MEEKEKFNWKWFFIGLASTLIPAMIISFLILNWKYGSTYGMQNYLNLSIFLILAALIGMGAWGSFKNRNRSLAKGLLIGGLLPFAVLFIVTGGCGLVRI